MHEILSYHFLLAQWWARVYSQHLAKKKKKKMMIKTICVDIYEKKIPKQ